MNEAPANKHLTSGKGVMGKEQPFISVVLSFFNQVESPLEIVQCLHTGLGKERAGRYELLYANDASTDRSLEILQQLTAGHRDIKIINMVRNFGASVCALGSMQLVAIGVLGCTSTRFIATITAQPIL